MSLIPLLLLAAQATASPAPASPPPAPPAETGSERYRACLAQLRSSPQSGLEAASAWRNAGGGLEARRCLGLAYAALERWLDAAAQFEAGARELEAARAPQRADLWVQAGNARLAADEPARAVADFDAALAVPGIADLRRGGIHLDRARALVALGDTAGARNDIDRALALSPNDPMAWYLSASLARRAADRDRARTDSARALALAPENPDIVLFAGTIAGLTGDMNEAERLYRRVVQLAPESPAGREASESLATLREIEVPAEPAAPAAPPAGPAPTPAPATPPPQSR